jgi:Protein of unknown function (DUF2934)
VPRTNSSETSSTTTRTRRGASRSASESAASSQSNALDAAFDMSRSDADSSGSTPTYDEIAEAAYQRYLQRGGVDGRDFDDWLEAERELKARRRPS